MPVRPILLVDDYPTLATFCRLLKRRAEREVVHVKTFDDAMAKLRRPFTFSGLLLDIRLSDDPAAPSGFDVLSHVRKTEPRIPVAMLTGHLDTDLVARAAELGALYVPKPASLPKLEGFFAAVLEYDAGNSLDDAVDRVLARLGIEPTHAAARVLRLHAHGLSPAEICTQLSISPNTYKGHCRELRQTSGRERVIDLVREVWRICAGHSPKEDG